MDEGEDYFYDPDVIETEPEPRKGGVPPHFYMGGTVDVHDFASARAFHERIVADYAEGRIVRDRARCLGYLLGSLLAWYKQETEQQLLDRVAAIEERLDRQHPRRAI